jgi:hypothetical protein
MTPDAALQGGVGGDFGNHSWFDLGEQDAIAAAEPVPGSNDVRPRMTTEFCLANVARGRIMGVMEVELLVVRECPHTVGAAQLLRTALDDIGLPDIDFRTTTIVSQADAERRGFRGSPAFFADGTDLFREPGSQPGLSCRLYRSSDPAAGVPDLVDLRRALKRAADRH